ncbi:SDR family oxidoreductase [Pseudoxanthomonas koreensis]|uniref:SDR family oxidoreductase n=1 Tax=Pseudoxanthomonas koreensis TaxID=266061 RepID=UPI001390DF22|nr:NAD(P)-dependent oxidoreductase [Pseudoxanthomonas koreensis]KAF1694636.1 nucleoside-diphosphate sugar epimerase [Pseudoxanthomonas koreensis]
MNPPPPRALVFGASGQIGRRVLARLQARGWHVVALCRGEPPAAASGVEWRRGALPDAAGAGDGFDAIFSCGPLDLFSLWDERHATGAARAGAFGSTSGHVKHASSEPAERELAGRLRAAEARLAAAAAARGATVTLLRPTLVYGAGSDRNLSRIAALARRHGFFLLPHDACGLRQPVHVDDLGDAALAALQRAGTDFAAYDLPGGETLPYREMVARLLQSLRPPARLLLLPGPLFGFAAVLARWLRVHDAGAAVLARMRQDLVFDASAAARDLGYAPRRFMPEAGMSGSDQYLHPSLR